MGKITDDIKYIYTEMLRQSSSILSVYKSRVFDYWVVEIKNNPIDPAKKNPWAMYRIGRQVVLKPTYDFNRVKRYKERKLKRRNK